MAVTRPAFVGRLAARAAVPVYPVIGTGMATEVQRLGLDGRVVLAGSPRHATVLLVAGDIGDHLVAALAQVHDAVPRPRATVWWAPPADGVPAAFEATTVVAADDDIVTALRSAHRGLMLGTRAGEPPILADEDPVPWRGEGPYGHGGSGMTGGTPYGRPIAGRDDDHRDGLTLDVVPITIGPFVPFLPPGLELRIVLSGDLVHAVEVVGPPDRDGGAVPEAPDPGEPPLVADVERARARHHLRWTAWALKVHGLDRLGQWALSLAESEVIGPGDIARLERRLRRSGLFTWHTQGLGRLPPDTVAGAGLGPVARAAGVDEDTRSDDPSYQELGFVPVTHDTGDTAPGGSNDSPRRARHSNWPDRPAIEGPVAHSRARTQRQPVSGSCSPGFPN